MREGEIEDKIEIMTKKLFFRGLLFILFLSLIGIKVQAQTGQEVDLFIKFKNESLDKTIGIDESQRFIVEKDSILLINIGIIDLTFQTHPVISRILPNDKTMIYCGKYENKGLIDFKVKIAMISDFFEFQKKLSDAAADFFVEKKRNNAFNLILLDYEDYFLNKNFTIFESEFQKMITKKKRMTIKVIFDGSRLIIE